MYSSEFSQLFTIVQPPPQARYRAVPSPPIPCTPSPPGPAPGNPGVFCLHSSVFSRVSCKYVWHMSCSMGPLGPGFFLSRDMLLSIHTVCTCAHCLAPGAAVHCVQPHPSCGRVRQKFENVGEGGMGRGGPQCLQKKLLNSFD